MFSVEFKTEGATVNLSDLLSCRFFTESLLRESLFLTFQDTYWRLLKVFHFKFWKHYSLWSQKRRNVTQLLSNKFQLFPDSAERDLYLEFKTGAERELSN